MAEDTLTFPHLWEVLQKYGQEVRNLYQDKLITAGKIAGGGLLNSVEFRVVQDGTAFAVELKLADYWKYVEAGSQGLLDSPPGAKGRAHWPPPAVLLEWIRIKPVIPRPDERTGRIPSEKSLAFLIGRKIRDHGIAPVPAMAEASAEIYGRFKADIMRAFAQDVQGLGRVALDIFGGKP